MGTSIGTPVGVSSMEPGSVNTSPSTYSRRMRRHTMLMMFMVCLNNLPHYIDGKTVKDYDWRSGRKDCQIDWESEDLRKIFIGGLANTPTTENKLKEYLEKFGEVASVRV